CVATASSDAVGAGEVGGWSAPSTAAAGSLDCMGAALSAGSSAGSSTDTVSTSPSTHRFQISASLNPSARQSNAAPDAYHRPFHVTPPGRDTTNGRSKLNSGRSSIAYEPALVGLTMLWSSVPISRVTTW